MKFISLIRYYFTVVVICVIGRVAFYLTYHSLIADGGETSLIGMVWNGLRLDFAVAGYVTFLPVLMLIVSVWWSGRVLRWIWRGYCAVIAFALTLAFAANIGLYEYWGFPLDSTPLFYMLTSPKDAAASVTTVQLIGYSVAVVALSAGLWIVISRQCEGEMNAGRLDRPCMDDKKTFGALESELAGGWKRKSGVSVGLLLCIGLLIIPVRGGFTTAVNNIGSVYFSTNSRLNHAAVNPVFSFIDSLTEADDFKSKYRFMDEAEADRLFAEMSFTALRDAENTDTLNSIELSPEFTKAMANAKIAGKGGVNVMFVVLESFSTYIMDEGGQVKGVTPNLESLAHEGVWFTDFYANSFRTDRGLVAILSGYPAQPTMSMMKYPHKTNNLYSIAHSLGKEGFDTQYVYGGDANFTNMRSYLMATGFDRIISEDDFDESLRTGKWGVNDEELFKKAELLLDKEDSHGNLFTVIQTSSSHEPYEVPHHKLDDEILNAFNYTDKCLGDFVAQLKKREDWNRTLLVILPDHLGCYPRNIDNFALYRYQIPFVITGGAITQAKQIATKGSQNDIAATLLGLLGVEHKEFLFSKDMLDKRAPHFAYLAVPDAMGMVTDDGAVIYDNVSEKEVLAIGNYKESCRKVKAYLQKLYDDVAER